MNRKIRIKCLNLIITAYALFAVLNSPAYSQDKPKTTQHEVWIDCSVGAALGDKYLNVVMGGLGASVQLYGPVFIGVRGALAGNTFDDDKPKVTIHDAGGVVGVFSNSKDFRLAAGAGVSYITAKYPDTDFFNVVGVPIEAGAWYCPNHVGFGLSAFCNLNSRITYYGLTIGAVVRFY